jgi:hypothetical protein
MRMRNCKLKIKAHIDNRKTIKDRKITKKPDYVESFSNSIIPQKNGFYIKV